MAGVMQTELAWAAGFFDGEGCSTVQGHPGGRTVAIKVNHVEPGPLRRFFDAVGGNFNGPYPGRTKVAQPFFTWNVAGRRARLAMNQLWPYLSEPKKHQYVVALCRAQRMAMAGE